MIKKDVQICKPNLSCCVFLLNLPHILHNVCRKTLWADSVAADDKDFWGTHLRAGITTQQKKNYLNINDFLIERCHFTTSSPFLEELGQCLQPLLGYGVSGKRFNSLQCQEAPLCFHCGHSCGDSRTAELVPSTTTASEHFAVDETMFYLACFHSALHRPSMGCAGHCNDLNYF